MKTIWDYPVSFPYGATTAPYSPSRPHRGEDRKAPLNTEIPVNGTVIGLVGSTGISTGSHLHTQKVTSAGVVHPRGGGKTLPQPAVVIEVGNKSDIGNYVRIKDKNGTVWSYFHLSKVLVKQGQELGEEDMTIDRPLSIWLWRSVKLKHSPTETQIKSIIGKDPVKVLEDWYDDGDTLEYRSIIRNKYPEALADLKACQAGYVKVTEELFRKA